jgi:CRP-like cAMP-binding protein
MHDKSEVRENQLLAALPEEALERLQPSMECVVLPPGEILYDFEDELTHIYFPNRNTVVSFLGTTDEHDNVEVGLCGNEGAVGFAGLFVFSEPKRRPIRIWCRFREPVRG